MYHISANEVVGRRISDTRRELGMSREKLADRINELTNIHITADMLGRYERGERGIDQDELVAIAIGLGCSIQNLIDTIDPRLGELPDPKRQISRLTPEEHKIMRTIATEWRGDRRALIIADGCYAALPEKYALRAIMGLMEQVSLALAAGEIKADALPSGLPHLEDKIGALLSKKR